MPFAPVSVKTNRDCRGAAHFHDEKRLPHQVIESKAKQSHSIPIMEEIASASEGCLHNTGVAHLTMTGFAITLSIVSKTDTHGKTATPAYQQSAKAMPKAVKLDNRYNANISKGTKSFFNRLKSNRGSSTTQEQLQVAELQLYKQCHFSIRHDNAKEHRVLSFFERG